MGHLHAVDVLQHAVGEHHIDRLCAQRECFHIPAYKTRVHTQLARHAPRSRQRIDVHVQTDRNESSASRGHAPTSPTASNVEHDLAGRRGQRPLRDRIAFQLAARARVQIPVGVHEPIVYKRVYRRSFRARVALAELHVFWDSFASNGFREYRNSPFDWENVPPLTNQRFLADLEIAMIDGARENMC